MKQMLILFVGVICVVGLYFIFELQKPDYLVEAAPQASEAPVYTPKVSTSTLNILFVGDIMTDRNIRKVIKSHKDVSSFLGAFLPGLVEGNKPYDYVVANLEGPITSYPSKTLLKDGTYSKELTFTFPVETLSILKALNIKVVSLANNHTANFGRDGFDSTKKLLDSTEISHFGNPYNTSNEEDSLSTTVCKKDICIAYVGYNQFTGNNKKEIFTEEIAKLKITPGIDFIVVFPHWGDEYQKVPNTFQVDLAHSFIDAGADIVIGAHPHVIQSSEVYNGKQIYYSLGNYIFDQWFSEDVKHGLGVEVKFSKETIGANSTSIYSIVGTKHVDISREKVEYK